MISVSKVANKNKHSGKIISFPISVGADKQAAFHRNTKLPSRLALTTQSPGPLAGKVKAIFYEAQLVQQKHLVEKPQVLCK